VKAARLLITLVIAAGLVGYAVWRSSRTTAPEEKLVGFQDSDAPFAMPKNGKPDMRFHFLSAWQANQVPTASRMDTPMGSENGALVYNAQKFWEMNEKRGGHHTGDDLNGIGGMNTAIPFSQRATVSWSMRASLRRAGETSSSSPTAIRRGNPSTRCTPTSTRSKPRSTPSSHAAR
jgi:hypothetical protein